MSKNKNELGLTLGSFDGRNGNSINVDMFSDFEKGITNLDFQTKYTEDKFHILKGEGMERLKMDILNKAEEANEALLKGEAGEDAPTKNSVIKEGAELLKGFETIKVENTDGTFETYFVKGKTDEELGK